MVLLLLVRKLAKPILLMTSDWLGQTDVFLNMHTKWLSPGCSHFLYGHCEKKRGDLIGSLFACFLKNKIQAYMVEKLSVKDNRIPACMYVCLLHSCQPTEHHLMLDVAMRTSAYNKREGDTVQEMEKWENWAMLNRDQEAVMARIDDRCADTCKVLIAGKLWMQLLLLLFSMLLLTWEGAI